jgi:hypothetical protein
LGGVGTASGRGVAAASRNHYFLLLDTMPFLSSLRRAGDNFNFEIALIKANTPCLMVVLGQELLLSGGSSFRR